MGRSRSQSPSRPTSQSAPRPTSRSKSPAPSTPAKSPTPSAPVQVQVQSQSPGLGTQIMANAASVAIGSVAAHGAMAAARNVFGGDNSNTAQQTQHAQQTSQTIPNSIHETLNSKCNFETHDFLDCCARNSADLRECTSYFDALVRCKTSPDSSKST